MNIDLTELSEDELVDLNRRIIARLQLLLQTRSQEAMLEFRIGDRASFTPECGHEVAGTVVRSTASRSPWRPPMGTAGGSPLLSCDKSKEQWS